MLALPERRIRLTLLLACLGALAFAFLATRTDLLKAAGGPPTVAHGAGCAGAAPPVAHVAASQLPELRARLARLGTPLHGRVYAEGAITGENAWSDNTPLSMSSQPASASLAAGYEMRWWARNGDDVAADVFVFSGPGEAQAFLGLAASTRCHAGSSARDASWPPNAHNLTWINPDRFSEEDVYLLRGRRVYRVVDVRPQKPASQPRRRQQRIAFLIVDTLACLLPEAECRLGDYRIAPRTRTPVLTASLDRLDGV
ncbi:MAG TPA: hypothetical protein VIC06_03745 [Solirubrobacteraceae bacterium]|jgi:hypothetical protein